MEVHWIQGILHEGVKWLVPVTHVQIQIQSETEKFSESEKLEKIQYSTVLKKKGSCHTITPELISQVTVPQEYSKKRTQLTLIYKFENMISLIWHQSKSFDNAKNGNE